MFFSYTTACTVVFFLIAMRWPGLMKVWKEKELRFLSHPYEPYGSKLSVKIGFAAVVIVILAFTEHGLFLANSAYNHYRIVDHCNWTIEEPLSYFLEKQFHFFFTRYKINLPLGLFLEIMNISYTFGWNYMEMFVMIVSLGLGTRFWQINYRLDGLKGKVKSLFNIIYMMNLVFEFSQVLPESVWIEIRTDYVVLCELMERVDYELRFLILLSNLNNLYFICFQLLNIYE